MPSEIPDQTVRITFGNSTKDIQNEAVTLNTLNHKPSANIIVESNNISNGSVSFGDSTYNFNGSISKTIECQNKFMGYNIKVNATSDTRYVEFYSDAPFSIKSANNLTSTASRRKGWEGTITYSYDTLTWTEWDAANTDVMSSSNLIKDKYRLYMRGLNNTHLTSAVSTSSTYCWQLTATTLVYCSGNIAHLLDYLNPPTTLTANYAFNHLFDGWTYLASAPILPFTSLTTRCYRYMFANCASLTISPALPATSLGAYCYEHMFYNCDSLITLPALPATIVVNNCYTSMFASCAKIKLSTTKTGDYQTTYRIPTSGTGQEASSTTNWNDAMFSTTGGTFTGLPALNTNYYTTNTIIPSS